HFAYRPLSGDGTIVARLVNSSGVGATQPGVMFRETLLANSTNAFIEWFSGFSSAYLYDRASTGGGTAVSNNVSVYNLPYWFKVTRAGNVFSSYVSPDGVYWTQVGSSITISMAQNLYVGLADANSTT